MNEIELNNLITRAQKFIDRTMPVEKLINGKNTSIDYKFTDIDNAYGEGEEGRINYRINGLLKAPDGETISRSLLDIIRYMESK